MCSDEALPFLGFCPNTCVARLIDWLIDCKGRTVFSQGVQAHMCNVFINPKIYTQENAGTIITEQRKKEFLSFVVELQAFTTTHFPCVYRGLASCFGKYCTWLHCRKLNATICKPQPTSKPPALAHRHGHKHVSPSPFLWLQFESHASTISSATSFTPQKSVPILIQYTAVLIIFLRWALNRFSLAVQIHQAFTPSIVTPTPTPLPY